jgi:hypothetical protein
VQEEGECSGKRGLRRKQREKRKSINRKRGGAAFTFVENTTQKKTQHKRNCGQKLNQEEPPFSSQEIQPHSFGGSFQDLRKKSHDNSTNQTPLKGLSGFAQSAVLHFCLFYFSLSKLQLVFGDLFWLCGFRLFSTWTVGANTVKFGAVQRKTPGFYQRPCQSKLGFVG